MTYVPFDNQCRFNAVSSGIGPFVVASAVPGSITPAQALAGDGASYFYFARSANNKQWEYGHGTYTRTSPALTLTRVVTSNSDKTLFAVNFATPPIVDVFPSAPPTLDVQPFPFIPPLPTGHIWGFQISMTSVNTIQIQPGRCVDSQSANYITQNTVILKNLSSWVPGTGGGFDTGSPGANSWHYVYAIMRPDTGQADYCISDNPSTPTVGTGAIPAAYTSSRRIGCVYTDASVHFPIYSHIGDRFVWYNSVVEYTSFALPVGATVFPLSGVPPVFDCVGQFQVFANGLAAGNTVAVFSPFVNGPAGITLIGPAGGGQTSATLDVLTNTTPSIVVTSTAAVAFSISTISFTDHRGREMGG